MDIFYEKVEKVEKEISSNNFYVLHYDDDNLWVYSYQTVEQLMYNVSKYYAFSDCDDSSYIIEIVCAGRSIEYIGWKPNMEYIFIDSKTKEVVWDEYFPQWEH